MTEIGIEIVAVRREKVWTLDDVAKLEIWWPNTRMKITEMARLLNVSRNAVIGKADRLKLPERKIAFSEKAEIDATVKRHEVRLGPSPRCCQFPLWKDGVKPTYEFCGKPVISRYRKHIYAGAYVTGEMMTSYCAEHFAHCYQVSRSNNVTTA